MTSSESPSTWSLCWPALKSQLQKTDYYQKLERARQMLRRYLSPRVADIAEEYSETGNIPPPAERQVAICFTDIRGFTALSETLDPGQLFASLSGHLRRQVELVYRHGGYVDKFNGDGIMAVFDGPGMVEKCCRCAVAIMEEASGRNPDEDKLPIGVGIHTGRVMVGNIGSPEHFDYSIIGATVNLAARLCGYAQPETIIVSSAVREACRAGGRSRHFSTAGSADARRQRNGADLQVGRGEGEGAVHVGRQGNPPRVKIFCPSVHPSRAEIQTPHFRRIFPCLPELRRAGLPPLAQIQSRPA